MENNKSLILTNTSIEKIEKQISIGNKILELANQSFVLLISKDYLFQIITLNDYKKTIKNISLNKKSKNIFIDNLVTIELATRNSIVIFFTKSGKYFSSSINKLLKVKNLKDYFNVDFQDNIIDVIAIDDKLENINLIFATSNGLIKRSKINLFLNECINSELAIKLYENDFLKKVIIADDNNQIVLSTKFGQVVRFDIDKIKPLSKKTYGNIGINLLDEEKNNLNGLAKIEDFKDYVLVITEKGKMKKSSLEDYRITNRGGKGVKTALITNDTGYITNVRIVNEEEIYLLITNLNNMHISEIKNLKIVGRVSKPTKVFKLNENEIINSIIKLPRIN